MGNLASLDRKLGALTPRLVSTAIVHCIAQLGALSTTPDNCAPEQQFRGCGVKLAKNTAESRTQTSKNRDQNLGLKFDQHD